MKWKPRKWKESEQGMRVVKIQIVDVTHDNDGVVLATEFVNVAPVVERNIDDVAKVAALDAREAFTYDE